MPIKSEDSGWSHKCTSDVLPSGARKVLPVVFAGKNSVRGQRNVREKRSFERKVCTRVQGGIIEIPRKENPRIPLDMGRDTNAGRVGRG